MVLQRIVTQTTAAVSPLATGKSTLSFSTARSVHHDNGARQWRALTH
jgi:hypothetical protein